MDKKIPVASYWLGIVCVVMTVILRGLAALGCGQSWYRKMGPGSPR
jgi:hypothetical protein